MRRISRQEYLDFSNHLRLKLQASTQNFAPDQEIISTRDLPPLSAGGVHVTHSRQPSVVDVQSLRDSSVFSPVSFASTTTSPLSSSYPLTRQLISPVSQTQTQTPFESPKFSAPQPQRPAEQQQTPDPQVPIPVELPSTLVDPPQQLTAPTSLKEEPPFTSKSVTEPTTESTSPTRPEAGHAGHMSATILNPAWEIPTPNFNSPFNPLHPSFPRPQYTIKRKPAPETAIPQVEESSLPVEVVEDVETVKSDVDPESSLSEEITPRSEPTESMQLDPKQLEPPPDPLVEESSDVKVVEPPRPKFTDSPSGTFIQLSTGRESNASSSLSPAAKMLEADILLTLDRLSDSRARSETSSISGLQSLPSRDRKSVTPHPVSGLEVVDFHHALSSTGSPPPPFSSPQTPQSSEMENSSPTYPSLFSRPNDQPGLEVVGGHGNTSAQDSEKSILQRLKEQQIELAKMESGLEVVDRNSAMCEHHDPSAPHSSMVSSPRIDPDAWPIQQSITSDSSSTKKKSGLFSKFRSGLNKSAPNTTPPATAYKLPQFLEYCFSCDGKRVMLWSKRESPKIVVVLPAYNTGQTHTLIEPLESKPIDAMASSMNIRLVAAGTERIAAIVYGEKVSSHHICTILRDIITNIS
jgi:hypothetical protein